VLGKGNPLRLASGCACGLSTADRFPHQLGNEEASKARPRPARVHFERPSKSSFDRITGAVRPHHAEREANQRCEPNVAKPQLDVALFPGRKLGETVFLEDRRFDVLRR
jgi:hypothetical protein